MSCRFRQTRRAFFSGCGTVAFVALILLVQAALGGGLSAGAAVRATTTSPIKHVVVLMEENHSFDNVLGKFCVEVAQLRIVRPGSHSKCDGVTDGKDSSGQVSLVSAPDIVPNSGHEIKPQVADIDGGKMDGFNRTAPCTTTLADCYNQYDPLAGPCTSGSCIANLGKLATKYTVSDRTFELHTSPSWEGHLYLVTANQDGFYGDNPRRSTSGPQPVAKAEGWGCDAGTTTLWSDLGTEILVPSCVPDASGSLGPNWAGYKGPKAAHIPTIFDELDANSLSWKLYAGDGGPSTADTNVFPSNGWQWAICPSFAECLYSSQRNNVAPASQVATDAAAGTLPAFSIITPTTANSQHNTYSMSEGDNYVGQLISAIQKGPDWASTAIFITYDDCGCFYDHVNPLPYNSSWGVRVPMVIVSPYAKEGYTDSGPTTFAGILKFVETTFGLASLNSNDANAYGYSNSFCFDPTTQACTPAGTAPVAMVSQSVATPTAAQVAAQQAAAQQDT